MDWLFQANPKRYDLLGHAAAGIDDNWSMNQHRDLVSIGDETLNAHRRERHALAVEVRARRAAEDPPAP